MNVKYKQIKNHMFKAYDFLLNIIFPISCLSCQKGEKYLCPQCEKKIIINKKFFCPNCKKINANGAYCNSCQTKYELEGLWISSDYHIKSLKILIKNFKYHFNKNLAPLLAKLIISFLQKNKLIEKSGLLRNSKNLIIIPVPLHKIKKRFRGFNQSEELAILISNKLKINLNNHALIRQKNTKAQAKLNKKQRIKNIKNAFIWTGENLINKNIILVDDVASTGATLDNCAKVLKSAGANKVWGLVLAKN